MKNNLLNSLSRNVNKLGFTLKKHSPEILVVAGVVGVVASTVMACKATLKVNDILEETKENVDTIHEATENGYTKAGEKYTQEDSKQDLTKVYVKTGIDLAKLYGPSIVLGTLSVTGIVASNNILKKRNIALAAAYATVDGTFKEYRGRVIEKFGERIDKELRYNIKTKEVEETTIDENGNEKKEVRKVDFIDPLGDISGYARFFEKYTDDGKGNTIVNPNWNSCNEYNIMFLKAQQNYANDKLRAKGYLFLNEVYEMLGLPASKEGQIVGWVYDPNPETAMGDNYIDFGLYRSGDNYSDYVYGHDDGILLDFNVDGNIWDLM